MWPLLLLSAFAVASDLDVLCTWTDTRWDHHATLRVPGTATAFATASTGSGDAPRMDGRLGIDPWGGMRLRADLAAEGVSVTGDVDPIADEVFALHDGILRLGDAGIVAAGARLSVVGWSGDDPVVRPSRFGGDGFVPFGSRSAAVPCERLNVLWRPIPSAAESLAAAGLPPDLPERAITGRRGLTVRRAARSGVVGRVPASRWPRGVRLIDERDGFARVAIVEWTGVVWTGWVRAERLGAYPEDQGSADVLGALSALGGAATPAPYEVHRCAQDQPLSVWVGGHPHVVGTVAAGAAVRVVGPHGDRDVRVALQTGWLAAVPGAEWLLPAAVRACPVEVVTPVSPPAQGDVFQGL